MKQGYDPIRYAMVLWSPVFVAIREIAAESARLTVPGDKLQSISASGKHSACPV